MTFMETLLMKMHFNASRTDYYKSKKNLYNGLFRPKTCWDYSRKLKSGT